MENAILLRKEGAIAHLTLNRPEVHNAANGEMMRQFVDVMHSLELDDDTRVVIVKGSGKSFCSGADIKGASDKTVRRGRERILAGVNMLRAVVESNKPVVSCVHGHALGLGLSLVAVSDLAIASEDAIFGMPEINIGFFPAMMVAPMIQAVAKKYAFEMFFTGRRLSAHEVKEWGLLNRVVSPESLDKATLEIANTLAEKDFASIKLGKESFRNILKMDFDTGLQYGADLIWAITLNRQ